jgi:DNA (cytosine-5)-methyltransferase 1
MARRAKRLRNTVLAHRSSIWSETKVVGEPVIDLFSCGGGMSAGFSRAFGFELVAAVDLEVAKPSGKSSGETGCNAIYEANHALEPISADLSTLSPAELMGRAGVKSEATRVLISCAPCTDFSRANPQNHLVDKERNSLVSRSGVFAQELLPSAFVMENARELLTGNHGKHFQLLHERLVAAHMRVSADVHMLTKFGLPQLRERALVIAIRGSRVRTLGELWEGWEVSHDAITVRSALGRLERWREEHPIADPTGDVTPGGGPLVSARIAATPPDGGGWVDLGRSGRFDLMTPDCRRRFASGDLGSHPDVYGRMWWDRPAPTIKRECAHTGNGRYLHPEADRLLTVREMAALQGFPFTYQFPLPSVANRYRAIGDAVPPLIARQIAACVSWSLTGRKPEPDEWILPDTTLATGDLKRVANAPVPIRMVA